VSDPAEEPPRRRRMSPEERREDLLDAAAVVLVEHGVDALTMEAVGQQAGVSKSLAWNYFSNVGELAAALFDRELGALYDRIGEDIAAATDFEAKVRAAIGAYFDVLEERGAVLGIVQSAVSATSHGQVPRQVNTETFFVTLGGVIREAYDAEWPEAIASGATMAGLVATWGQIWGFADQMLGREDAIDRCARWIVAGLDANHRRRTT
jgi:TetR/AcrR family transcriptional regulator, fatty acid biosynthesis regulator